MQLAQCPPSYHHSRPASVSFPPMHAYPPFHVGSMHDSTLPPIGHVIGPNNKRLAPPHSHPAESPAKKKQSKWTPNEDATIIELRGNGMKWEDISRQLPNRSAISCRLRFQNYLERRPEWDEEKKDKLARFYERFKKDMWEKVAKEMQMPWRAAEAMHWQLGEIEMAQRANVTVFHLASQQQQQQQPQTQSNGYHDHGSTSPISGTYRHSMPAYSFPLHGNPMTLPRPPSPSGYRQSNSNGSSPRESQPHQLRARADSGRHLPPANLNGASLNRTILPPLADVTRGPPERYTLPPAALSTGASRR